MSDVSTGWGSYLVLAMTVEIIVNGSGDYDEIVELVVGISAAVGLGSVVPSREQTLGVESLPGHEAVVQPVTLIATVPSAEGQLLRERGMVAVVSVSQRLVRTIPAQMLKTGKIAEQLLVGSVIADRAGEMVSASEEWSPLSGAE